MSKKSKLIDQQLSEKFNECKEILVKYERPNDQVVGTVLSKLTDMQQDMNNDVIELIRNVDLNLLRPLQEYQASKIRIIS